MNCPKRLLFVAAFTAASGCEHFPRFDAPLEPPGEKVKMPAAPTVSLKSYQTGQRLEEVGRDLLAANPFPGVEPLFHLVGVKDLMLFHRGPGELFISEGLVDRCRTDEQLAAVLCSELGKMKTEKLAARRVGQDRDGFPEKDSTTPSPKRPAEPQIEAGDPGQHARELLSGAGIDPVELDRVTALLREAEKNDTLRKQMAGSAPAPQWRK